MMKKLILACIALLLLGSAQAAPQNDVESANSQCVYAAEMSITRLLAKKDDAWAQFYMGCAYVNGQGVVQSDKEAIKWYRLSALQGNAAAQYNLGLMYSNGQGVMQNNILAHMWFNLGAAQGNKKASENRDSISKYMNAQQIAKAQVLAVDCQASNYQKCN